MGQVERTGVQLCSSEKDVPVSPVSMSRKEVSDNIPILYAAHVLGDVGEVSKAILK